MDEVPSRTNVDELLEMIFEQFDTSSLVADAWFSRFSRDARVGCVSVKTHGSIVGRSRCIVHGP